MRVKIGDDEPLARDRLRRMLSAIDNSTVVGDAGDGEQALVLAKRGYARLGLYGCEHARNGWFDCGPALGKN